MRKTSKASTSERSGLRIVAAIALTGSLAAFGCSTNRMPGNGESAKSAPAAGSVAPNSTSTSGSSSGGSTPQAMIPATPAAGYSASEAAVATLKADEAFHGKNLGQAAPAAASAPSNSPQQVTGQFVPPAPQIRGMTVNSSISSAPTPSIVSGAGEGGGGGTLAVAALPAGARTGVAAGATVAPTPALASGVTNGGTTGVSNTTATPIVNATSTARPTTAAKQTGSGAAKATTAKGVTASSAAAKSTSSSAKTDVRVETTPAGAAVVTNAPPSVFRRFLNAIGLRRTTTTTSTTTTDSKNQ